MVIAVDLEEMEPIQVGILFAMTRVTRCAMGNDRAEAFNHFLMRDRNATAKFFNYAAQNCAAAKLTGEQAKRVTSFA